MTADLFGVTTAEPVADRGCADRLDLRERLALRKLNAPAGFKFFRLEFVKPDSTIMEGCVVTRTYTKGPRKGRPVYDGPRRMVVVTEAEIAAERGAYEAETGACAECVGTGKTWAGWNHETGHKWRTCARCKGTAKAPA